MPSSPDDLDRLWLAARQRLEANGRRLAGSAVITDPTPAEREAVAGLLGLRRRPAREVRVGLIQLDGALRQSRHHVGLIDWLEGRSGPLRNLPAEREAARSQESDRRAGIWSVADGHPFTSTPTGEAWLAALRDRGLLTRLAPGHEAALLAGALAVLDRLPSEGGTTRARLAAEAVRDPHALDPGRPLATVVLRAVARQLGREPPTGAPARRRLWRAMGVAEDELTSHVLAFNLPGLTPGEPERLTLRRLRRGLPGAAPPEVWLCENPSVVAEAADRWGQAGQPMVCLEGRPVLAVNHLLDLLAGDGSAFHYHGDFDWPGVDIAAAVWARHSFTPWRYTALDYEGAAAAGGEPLNGRPRTTPWDTDLSPAMVARAVTVYEEQVLSELIADLECVPPHR